MYSVSEGSRVLELDKKRMAGQLAGIAGNSNVLVDEPMKNHTSFKLGGPADIMVTPPDTGSLADVCKACRENGVPLFIMGNGTNLVVRDKGIRGVVVKLRENMSGYRVEGECITAQAGILLSRLSRIALDHGLTGLEFAEGIPGTLGGAVTMNAGAYIGEMSMIVESTEYLGRDGAIVTLNRERHRFGKRSSFVQTDGGIVLETRVRLKKGDPEEIRAKMEEFAAQRREKQPLELPSAGSIFKRPEGYFAGKLVQDCGLKGFRIGGAEVSCLHCGFIVNTGTAVAADVIALIKHIQAAVLEKYGVELQTEVRIVGEE
jgi:UDP-N-acetylmuramate dehydrogenase